MYQLIVNDKIIAEDRDPPELFDTSLRFASRHFDLGEIAGYRVADREKLKSERAAAVAAIKVTTAAGHAFDGDEASQGRMARAFVALQATGAPSVPWVLADNSVIEASAAELSEALALSVVFQAAIWVIAPSSPDKVPA